MPAHTKSAKCRSLIAVIGIDIGKNVFHLIGLNKRGAIILKSKLSRGQLENFLANLPSCLIGMEACAGAHHLSRRLIAPADAGQICEAFPRVIRTITAMPRRSPKPFSGPLCALWQPKRWISSIYRPCTGCGHGL